MKNVVAIIQARYGSRRLKGKVLSDISGRPMLWHVVKRAQEARLINSVVIATSVNAQDGRIEEFARQNNFNLFRGSEADVLGRYYQAAKKFKADIIIRITGDCPLISPEIIDKVVAEFLKGKYDYVTNTLIYTYPEGCDVEVFSFSALEKAHKECPEPFAREHVTAYIKNSGRFKIKNVPSINPVNAEEYIWSVNTITELEFVREVYRRLYGEGEIFSHVKIMDLLEREPGLREINRESVLNEGYYKALLTTAKIKAKKIPIKKSLSLKNKASRLIPDCSQTFSKGPSQFVQNVAPVFLEKGRGSHVWDVDGNEFIDYAMALGPVILGHNYPEVNSAVKRAIEKGVTFSLPNPLEVELARILTEVIPCAQMVRFGKNGSDATSGAVRVARAFTGRDKIACCGYHGWQDWYIASTSRNMGIPIDVRKLTLTFAYNKIETLEKIFRENRNQVACVIMEPVGIEEPRDNFLQKVKEVTHKNGALLIFDEVVTGFRLSLGGAQEYFGVTPDLACVGKAMGNGFPISAVVGRRGIMELFEEIFFSFTFGGEIASIAAAIETINVLKSRDVISFLWEQGRRIKDGYNVLTREYGLEKYTRCAGLSPRSVISFKDGKGSEDLLLKSLFQQECIKRGILFTGAHNICFSHSNPDIDYTLRVYNTVLAIIRDALKKNKVRALLKGEAVRPVFRKA